MNTWDFVGLERRERDGWHIDDSSSRAQRRRKVQNEERAWAALQHLPCDQVSSKRVVSKQENAAEL